MLTILDEEFAPITSCAVFVNAPLERITTFETERERTRPERDKDRPERERSLPVTVTELNGRLRQLLPVLEPLTAPITLRRLWIQTRHPEWSVFFAGNTRGTVIQGPTTVQGYCHHLQVPGLEIVVSPHTLRRDGTGRAGNMVFSMHDRTGDEARVVAAQLGDGDRWVFTDVGVVQPFEQPETYKARRIRDRLTSRMIDDYCAALGLHPFEEDFYGPRALLLEHPVECLPPYFDRSTLVQMSLTEVQAEAGIVPGEAAGLPG